MIIAVVYKVQPAEVLETMLWTGDTHILVQHFGVDKLLEAFKFNLRTSQPASKETQPEAAWPAACG